MNAPEFKALKYEEPEPGICMAIIDNPAALGSLTLEMQRDLIRFADFLNANDEARVGIITGTGEKSFISGIDLKGLPESEANSWWGYNPLKDACAAIEACHKPVIAMINGYCIGGGFELALACDIRIFSENASAWLPELGLGFTPGAGGLQRLSRCCGTSVAKSIIFSGKKHRFKGEELLRMNIAHDVVPLDQLRDVTLDFARNLASMAPLAIAYAKMAIDNAYDMDRANALLFEDVIGKAVLFTEDSQEGPRSFAEKRPPVFKGR